MNLIGNVKDRDVIIVDDICDSGTTLLKAAEELKKNGAKKVFACVTHPVFSKNAIEKFKHSVFDEVIVTDTIPMQKNIPHNVVQISIAPLLAEAIRRVQNGDSLSNLYGF